ncbi:hypothetical protein, partial [Nocardia jinanensis]|uniref:hypothetical protein n=1 Tax=Nocardia jinanensis TaxID=382504 RepID=UPI003987058F
RPVGCPERHEGRSRRSVRARRPAGPRRVSRPTNPLSAWATPESRERRAVIRAPRKWRNPVRPPKPRAANAPRPDRDR